MHRRSRGHQTSRQWSEYSERANSLESLPNSLANPGCPTSAECFENGDLILNDLRVRYGDLLLQDLQHTLFVQAVNYLKGIGKEELSWLSERASTALHGADARDLRDPVLNAGVAGGNPWGNAVRHCDTGADHQ